MADKKIKLKPEKKQKPLTQSALEMAQSNIDKQLLEANVTVKWVSELSGDSNIKEALEKAQDLWEEGQPLNAATEINKVHAYFTEFLSDKENQSALANKLTEEAKIKNPPKTAKEKKEAIEGIAALTTKINGLQKQLHTPDIAEDEEKSAPLKEELKQLRQERLDKTELFALGDYHKTAKTALGNNLAERFGGLKKLSSIRELSHALVYMSDDMIPRDQVGNKILPKRDEPIVKGAGPDGGTFYDNITNNQNQINKDANGNQKRLPNGQLKPFERNDFTDISQLLEDLGAKPYISTAINHSNKGEHVDAIKSMIEVEKGVKVLTPPENNGLLLQSQEQVRTGVDALIEHAAQFEFAIPLQRNLQKNKDGYQKGKPETVPQEKPAKKMTGGPDIQGDSPFSALAGDIKTAVGNWQQLVADLNSKGSTLPMKPVDIAEKAKNNQTNNLG